MHDSLNKKIYLGLVLAAMFFPSLTLAATVYFDTKESDFFVGDNIVFNVKVDSEDQSINAVEGKILLEYAKKSALVSDLSVAGSNFSLWPRKPSLSMDERNIAFVGGEPGGVKSGDMLVFKIVLNLEKAGKLSLKSGDFFVYLNDGKGTKVPVGSKDFEIEVLSKPQNFESRREWVDIVQNDTTAPEPFEVYLGQEGSVFEGKKFLSFNTTDKQSDIRYYEVYEGDLPGVRSSSTYVLQEQDKPVEVKVIAYDSAGNSRKSIYSSYSATTNNFYYLFIFIFIFILLISFFAIHKRRKKNEYVQK